MTSLSSSPLPVGPNEGKFCGWGGQQCSGGRYPCDTMSHFTTAVVVQWSTGTPSQRYARLSVVQDTNTQCVTNSSFLCIPWETYNLKLPTELMKYGTML